MGYSFTIGEAAMRLPDPGDGPMLSVWVAAPLRLVRDGRRAGALTDASYTGWRHVCERAGLLDLFYGPVDDRGAGLLAEHPGCALLTPAHLAVVTAALAAWRARGDTADDAEIVLERLEWLAFWFAAALEHCKVPAFYNR